MMMDTAPAFEDERRRFKRFKVEPGSSFVVTSEWPTLGEIVDISEGGLAFTYKDARQWTTELPEGCMVFGKHDSCLNSVPLRIVSDRLISKGNRESGGSVRRRCVEFDKLTKEQHFLLECFIWINGVVDA